MNLPAASILSLALALPAVVGPTAVQAFPPEDVVRLEVLPGWRTDQGTQMAGIRLTLAPGWKTYWRAPGDAGIPPDFDWSDSRNVAQTRMHWPVPEVFHQNGMRSIGYSGQVVLPVEITPRSAGEVILLAGEVELGVCQDVCIPMHISFTATLDREGGRDPAIVAALVDRPLTAEEARVGDVRCTLEPSDGGLRVTASLQMPHAGGHEAVVIEAGSPDIWVSEPQVARDGDWLVASAQMLGGSDGGLTVDRSRLRITVLGAEQAVDVQGCRAG
ncbi:MAG: hypothetical protein JJT81_02550 [Rubellimicrobium sp.]|nr:hypothetical protein [Rubellimicrobium sp.]